MRRHPILLSALFALAACTNGGPSGPLGDVGSGRYQVTINVNDGSVIEGTIDLTVAADSTITGTKSLALTHGAGSGLDPVFEGGPVEGKVYPDRFWLGLNPRYADHNFYLDGAPASGHLVGQFTHVGIVGTPQLLGSFTAIRR
jgi:hypothetical protein